MIKNDPQFTVFVDMLETAGLSHIFNCAGPFTALVPNNKAMMKVDPTELVRLLQPENRKELRELLLYHILPGRRPSAEFQKGEIPTIEEMTVGVNPNPLRFNNAQVLRMDIDACNGLVHELDDLLVGKSDPLSLSLDFDGLSRCRFWFIRQERA